MAVSRSDIVVSTAGRDKDKVFFVLSEDGEFAYLADGKERKLEKPKKKRLKHLQLVSESDCRAAAKLRSGEKLTNSELRKALAEFRSVRHGEKGGM